MPEESYVFISYSKRDDELAKRLSSDLSNNGIRVWRDMERVAAGENWAQQTQKSLSGAAVMLFLVSGASISRFFNLAELSFFVDRGGTVIPLVIDDAGASAMPLVLGDIQWIDFRADYDLALQKLLSALPQLVHGVPEAGIPHNQARGYVFFNYAEEDTGFIESLAGFFRKHGYAYWDFQNSDRDYHSDLDLELETVIRDAAAVVSILSPSWKASRWTRKEYLFAEEVRTPVFLLRLNDPGPTLIIAGAHFIDFTANHTMGFSRLAKALERKGL